MADKMLNAYDIWITAQGVKSRTRLRSVDNISLEGVKRLRELILDLAIRGKLVSQNSKEEPAGNLINKLSTKETKTKNVLEPIDNGEKFMDIPLGWEWVKLGSVGDTNIGLTYSPNNISDSGTPVLRSSNIQNGKISYDDLVRVNRDIAKKNLVEEGDLLICARNGSKSLVGKCAVIPELNEQTSFGAFMAIFRSDINEYVKLFLESPHYRSRLEGVSTTTINQITQDNLKNTVVPLPPLPEQHRIVAKVDELRALCDALEQQEMHHLKSHQLLVETLLGTLTRAADAKEFQQAWNKLYAHFDDLFTTEDSIDQLKQTILQLAIMGKLVPQDPNNNIDISNHSIERIDDLDKPFILPVSWRWIRWSELLAQGKYSMKRGPFGSALRKGDFVDSGIRVFEQYNPINDDPNWVRYYITPEKYEEMKAFTAGPGDLLISCSGATLGRITELTDEVEPGIINQALLKVRLNSKLISNRYFILVFRSKFIQDIIFEKALGSAIPNMVGVAELKRIVMGLPPISEQQKIIKKLDELFALCDRLKGSIAEAQKVANQMAEGVLEPVG